MTLDELGNVKTATITEWIAEPGPRRTIRREFKEFLLTYVDEHGTSVYGERIRDMGEREYSGNILMLGRENEIGTVFLGVSHEISALIWNKR